MKAALFALCASLALGAETKQERGKRVIDEAVAALGGDKFLTMVDRVESGRAYSFYRDRLTGLSVAKIYTRYLEKPVGERHRTARTSRRSERMKITTSCSRIQWIHGYVSWGAADAHGTLYPLGGNYAKKHLLYPSESVEGAGHDLRIAGLHGLGECAG